MKPIIESETPQETLIQCLRGNSKNVGMWFASMQVKKAIILDATLLKKAKEAAVRLQCDDFMTSSQYCYIMLLLFVIYAIVYLI